jgi:hypothetical protein
MKHKGSCHCGAVAFEVEGDLKQAMECNCSHCSRKGFLLWFVPRPQFQLTSAGDLTEYTFNKHIIKHQFCAVCGCQPFAFGKDPSGAEMAAINVRCLTDIDLSSIKRVPFDGRSL